MDTNRDRDTDRVMDMKHGQGHRQRLRNSQRHILYRDTDRDTGRDKDMDSYKDTDSGKDRATTKWIETEKPTGTDTGNEIMTILTMSRKIPRSIIADCFPVYTRLHSSVERDRNGFLLG